MCHGSNISMPQKKKMNYLKFLDFDLNFEGRNK